MSGDRSRRFVGPRGGQLIFALAFLGVSVLLLSQIGTQTVRAEGAAFFAQPRFWPGLALAGMVGFGALHLWRLPWRQLTGADWRELRDWARALEFAAWFMAYVLLVPVLGYLPATLIFVPSLSWRMRMVEPSIDISWISTTPATGDEAATSLPAWAEVMMANRPLALCWATVPRTQGSWTVIWAWAALVTAAMNSAGRVCLGKRNMGIFRA